VPAARLPRRSTATPISAATRTTGFSPAYGTSSRRCSALTRSVTSASIPRPSAATDVEIDRLARQADDTLSRATGDAYDADDELMRTPNTTPPAGDRGRAQTPSESRRKT